MIDELSPYPLYRDASVAWLADVPEHWVTGSVKSHYAIQLGKMLESTERAAGHSEVPYLKAQHVQWFAVRTSDVPTMWASPAEIERFGVQHGDLLVCEGGEGGRCGLVAEATDRYIIQNALHRVRPLGESRNDYLQYVMSAVSSSGWFDAINSKATIAHFTREKFGSLRIPLPPVVEQTAIVRFLDHARLRIGRYVHAKQSLIRLLEEHKQAIILRAVSCGIDPSVRLKPSGVEWLSDVPEHWGVRRAKYLFREADQRSESGQEELLSVSHLTGVTSRSQKNVTMFMASSNVGHKLCEPGDLVINTMWAWMGALGVARQRGIVSPAYGVYRPLPQSSLMPEYADLLLTTKAYIAAFSVRSTGIQASRLRLYPDEFLRMPVLCPPPAEQRAIVAAATTETSQATQAILRTRREIELIREYRTRLIANVVTGKLDVREAARRLPDQVDQPEAVDALVDAGEDMTYDLDAVPEEVTA